jgi:phage baseplate assembly protein W
MRGFLIKSGDLSIGQGGYATVEHRAKIQQDLALALSEPAGTDRFHPNFGSTLPHYIGMAQNPMTRAVVEGEVRRVIANYVTVQRGMIESDLLGQIRSRVATDEIISRIESINIRQTFDAIRVRITLVTQAGQSIAINRTFTEG